ncbi:DMT family transporter [Falsibacillus albus]|uniref:DMT family transporter n=2 Tax=Falsibacillus albus TaxID=2478915 RepID=A0A3L7JYB2_9BACI|nr:DMT family transporter [Falsibacillus albus]
MNKKLISEASLFFVTFIWGTTFVIVQNALSVIPPMTFNFIRFLLAGILLLPFLYFTKKRTQAKRMRLKLFASGIILGIFLFLGYSLQTIGLQYTTPSKAGFITGLSVVLVPLLSFAFLKRRAAPIVLVGAAFSAIGLYLLTFAGSHAINKGDVYVFLCAIGFTFHILYTHTFSKNGSLLSLTIIQIFTVSILSGMASLAVENPFHAIKPDIIFSRNVLFAIMVTSVFATSAAYLIQTISQTYTSPAKTAIIFTMEPVFAALTSYFWIHERLSGSAAMGCFFILSGMVLAENPFIRIMKKKKAVRCT